MNFINHNKKGDVLKKADQRRTSHATTFHQYSMVNWNQDGNHSLQCKESIHRNGCQINSGRKVSYASYKVIRYTERYEQEMKCLKDTRSKENITCIYISCMFMGLLVYNGCTLSMLCKVYYSPCMPSFQ